MFEPTTAQKIRAWSRYVVAPPSPPPPKSVNQKKQNEKDRDRQQTPQYPAHIPPPSLRLVVHLRLPD
jgi:hypothetical protein